MCGRFSLYSTADLMKWLHGLREIPPLRPRYNIAPTQDIAVVRAAPGQPDDAREIVMMRWGYVPHWAEDPKTVPLMINARSETLQERPAFRDALATHRCLVPANGFFEWETTKQGKRPLYFHVPGEPVFGMAGLWSAWKTPTGDALLTCTILTGPPNGLVSPIHDRMPVIIPPGRYDTWLDPHNDETDALRALLRPYPEERMDAYPVTPKMNHFEYDEPAAVVRGGQQALF